MHSKAWLRDFERCASRMEQEGDAAVRKEPVHSRTRHADVLSIQCSCSRVHIRSVYLSAYELGAARTAPPPAVFDGHAGRQSIRQPDSASAVRSSKRAASVLSNRNPEHEEPERVPLRHHSLIAQHSPRQQQRHELSPHETLSCWEAARKHVSPVRFRATACCIAISWTLGHCWCSCLGSRMNSCIQYLLASRCTGAHAVHWVWCQVCAVQPEWCCGR